MIIDGKTIAGEYEENIKTQILKNNYEVCLAVVLVGEDPASQIYVKNKQKACERVGIKSKTLLFPADILQSQLEQEIVKLANDNSVHGILVQLPLPKGLNSKNIIDKIPYYKDVDGLTEINQGKLFTGNSQIVPCTPLGVLKLIQTVKQDLTGLDAVVIGRSNLVGKPASLLLLENNCTVTTLHSKSKDIKRFVKNADIVVSAVGKQQLLSLQDFKSGAIVIDVGINKNEQGKLCGDVEKGEREDIFITPVPKGVGPMTIAMLLENTLSCYKLQNN